MLRSNFFEILELSSQRTMNDRYHAYSADADFKMAMQWKGIPLKRA